MAINQKWILKERPTGLVDDSNFLFIEEDLPEINDGEILIQTEYLSVDPTQRMWLTDMPGYLPPIQIDEVIRSGGMGRVIASKNERFNEGELVNGFVGWQTHLISDGKGFKKVPELLPIPTMLNVLGLTGITAYFGLLDIGQPKEGETVVVSGAAGATGSVVAQIAKIKGCNVIGIAGGEEKCGWLEECGLDHIIDYKATKATKEIRRIAENGIDIYFDNVGGPLLEAVLYQINQKARIVICGAISNYASTDLPVGPRNLSSLIINRAKMEGFLVLDYLDRTDEAIQELSKWLTEGKIKHREDVQEGIENCPTTLNRLFTGQNIGKQILKI
jgi:NADPH-dependent curcumin reductase CurA